MDRLEVRLSADPAALARIRERLEPPRTIRLVLSALQLLSATVVVVVGALELVRHGPHRWNAYLDVAIGIAYGPLSFWYAERQRRESVFVPTAEGELVIDDAGLTIVRDGVLVPWRRVSAVRDLGEAFVFERGFGVPSIALFTNDVPDGGRPLWRALDARLVATRGLVRGTPARTTITNTAR